MKEKKIVRLLTNCYAFPFLAIMIFNTVNSLLRTGYFDLHQYVEVIHYKWNQPVFIILFSFMFLGLMQVILNRKWISICRIRKLSLGVAGGISLAAILLFRTVAKCDSEFLSTAAIQLAQNNYDSFKAGEYLYMYPFQLGYTAFMEVIYRLFGIENYIVFQLINMVCIVDIVFAIGSITWELFEDEDVYKAEMFLSMGMLPLFLLATFIYGDIIGWCMGVNAVLAMIRYLKSGSWKDVLKASVWLVFGVVIKNNVNILVVAAAIGILLYAIERKKPKALLWVLEIVIVSQLGMLLVNGIYTYRMGAEVPDGIPKIAWVAMSMQEPYEGGSASGWYNGYNWKVYAENNFDTDATVQACKENLKHTVVEMVHSPRYALHFFYDKFTSQWNEPTFMSLITNEWYSRNEEPQSTLAISFLYGTGREILYKFMNGYHFLIFFCTAIGCIALLKKWKLENAYFVLNIFGGILFHMLWEAKSRYVMGYFVLMLPLAAYGCSKLIELLKKCIVNKAIVRKN